MENRMKGAGLALLLAASWICPAGAQSLIPGCNGVSSSTPCTAIQVFNPLAQTTLSASSVSSRVAFPSTGTNINALVVNTGTVTAFIASGSSSVAATTSSIPVAPGQPVLVPQGVNTNLAAITASGSATLTVQSGTGQPAIVYTQSQISGGTVTLTGSLPAGSNIIGKVGIDQTTPGTTNGVQVNAALPAGTNAIGGVTITPGTSTPAAGAASAIVTGGVAVTLITGPVNGCYITNPLSATDQNIATAEVAYVNPVTTATAAGRGTNATLQPGQPFSCPPGMTTNLSAIAATTAHAFNVVKW